MTSNPCSVTSNNSGKVPVGLRYRKNATFVAIEPKRQVSPLLHKQSAPVNAYYQLFVLTKGHGQAVATIHGHGSLRSGNAVCAYLHETISKLKHSLYEKKRSNELSKGGS
jgi:hypothetical protein